MKKVSALILVIIFVVSLAGCKESKKELIENETGLETTKSNEAFSIGKSGVLFIGGEDNGKQIINQSMIHYLIPDQLENPSIVMLPGLGLSSYIYTSTPDGRNGWAYDFAKNGYGTYAVDTNNLGVSGMDISAFGTENQPKLSIWDQHSIWRKWGFGEQKDQPYKDTQYPLEAIDQLYASFSPQIVAMVEGRRDSAESSQKSGKGSSSADQTEVDNLIALLEEIGPSVLMVHSMGGVTGAEVVRQRPELVKALVVIEPVGSPTDLADLKEHFLSVPYLAVYGDYIESRGQTGRYEACLETAKILNENGGIGEVIRLTEMGINGNTHLMMQDKNSKEIADIITEWLNQNVK